MRLLPGGLGFFFDAVNYPGLNGFILGTFKDFLNSIAQKLQQFSTFSGKDRIGAGRPVDDRRDY